MVHILKEKFYQEGLQWKLDGKPAHTSEAVHLGGELALWFLQGYNNYGKYKMESK